MDRLRDFLLAAVVLSSLVLPLAADVWLTDANDLDPQRGFLLATLGLLWLALSLTANPWLTKTRKQRTYHQAVWVGQFLAVVGGLWIVAAPIHPEFGLIAAVGAFPACLLLLRRLSRPARPLRA